MSLFHVSGFEVDLHAGELRKHGRITRLQDKPLELLRLLMEQPNVLVTREQIIERLWGASRYHDLSGSVNQCVGKLRHALRDKRSNPQIIETIPRRGYRLRASVEPVASGLPDDCPSAGTIPDPQLEPPPLPRAIQQITAGRSIVGRETELQLLGDAWEAARCRRQQLVLVSGDQGIGKTSVAFAFARSVWPNATVLLGRCDKEASVPFAPFVEILDWVVQSWPVAAVREWLAAIEESSALRQLASAIAQHIPGEIETVPSTAAERRYRMFEAFTRLLQAVSASRPILLVLEDMHWADSGSVLLLRHIVRSMRESALCIIVTVCDSEPPQESWFKDMWTGLRRDPSATPIVLRGLRYEHIGSLVSGCTGLTAPPDLTRVLAESTGGNPLYVTELVRHMHETESVGRLNTLPAAATIGDLNVPESLNELIALRLSRLGADCHRLLTLASVVGREFRLSIVEPLAYLPEELLLDCIDTAVQAKVIEEVPEQAGSFSFTHQIVREVLYSGQTAARRARLHHTVAEVLERHSRMSQVSLAELAYHFGLAAPLTGAEKAVEYAIRAAEDEACCLAPEEAARYYSMAMNAVRHLPADSRWHGERLKLHEQRARSFLQAGQWMRAQQDFAAAMKIAETGPGMELKRCKLLIGLSETSFWLMDVASVRRFASEAQRLADRLGDRDLSADAIAWIGSAQAADGDVLGAVELDRRALARSDGLRSFGRARMPLTLYWAGLTTEAVEQGSQAVRYARESRDPAFLMYSLQHVGLALSGAGRYGEACRAFEEACSFGRRCAALPLLARATCMSAAPFFSLGDLDEAKARALEARELASRIDFEPPFVSAGIDLLLISARSQDMRSSAGLLDEVVRAVEKASGWHGWKWQLRLSQARAELALACGDLREARDAAADVVERSHAHSRLKYEAMGRATRSRALMQLGSRHALGDAQAAVFLARRLADPAILLDCIAVLLQLEPTEELVAEAEAVICRISAELPDERLRSRFIVTASGKMPAEVVMGHDKANGGSVSGALLGT